MLSSHNFAVADFAIGLERKRERERKGERAVVDAISINIRSIVIINFPENDFHRACAAHYSAHDTIRLSEIHHSRLRSFSPRDVRAGSSFPPFVSFPECSENSPISLSFRHEINLSPANRSGINGTTEVCSLNIEQIAARDFVDMTEI